MAIALLIVRVILGLGIAAHGVQKLFGWFEGHGLKGTGGFFESLGFRPGTLFALAAGVGETLGGVLALLGLGGPIGAALIIAVMLTAILSVHLGHGFFAAKHGSELPLLYIAGALALVFSGAGPYSLDELLGLTWAWPALDLWITVAIAVALAGVNLLARRPLASAPAASKG